MNELRDLQKLRETATSNIAQYTGQDFILPDAFKEKVKELSTGPIFYEKYSAIIVNSHSKLKIYLPNQWFYIASYFTDLYNELHRYKEYALQCISRERLHGGVKELSQDEKAVINSLDLSQESKLYLEKFITDIDWWGGGKSIERNDFYVSPILNAAGLVNATQTYIADLCAFLADKKELVDLIIDSAQEHENIGEQNINCVIYNEIDKTQYDEEKLGQILGRMYEEGINDRTSVARLHLFGLKFGVLINTLNFSIAKIIRIAKLDKSYKTELSKSISLAGLVSRKIENTAFWNPEEFKGNTPKKPLIIPNVSDTPQYLHYISAIKTKPFLLLAGISGTGKSRIVRELARACWALDSEEYKAQKSKNFEIIPVRPNWHDSTELLGYVSRINETPKFVAGDFIKFIIKAWTDMNTPYFLCLDEMNLAPVEQYFAEYLSCIESRCNKSGVIKTDPILAKSNEDWYTNFVKSELSQYTGQYDPELYQQFLAEGISLPPNLIVCGTVNMDETTYAFSRKVLDRAMTIEMNEVNLKAGLGEDEELLPNLSEVNILSEILRPEDCYQEHKAEIDEMLSWLEQINEKLEDTPFKIAYRSRNEIIMFVLNEVAFGGDMTSAFDDAVNMKILPRIEGDSKKVGTVLDDLQMVIKGIVGEEKITKSSSHLKLEQMKERMKNQYYCTYWS